MTRDEIMRLTTVAEKFAESFCNEIGDTENHHWGDAFNERFAELVAEAEREACAKVCEAEAEKWESDDGPICVEARMCAVAIRARGDA